MTNRSYDGTPKRAGTSNTSHDFPEDLRDWFPETELVQVLYGTVTSVDVDASPPGIPIVKGPSPDLPAPMMLSLLTYCYATGRYGSDEIEDVALTDPTVHYLCANRQPDWNAIRHFRRSHRDLLTECLCGLLQSARGRRSREPLAGSGSRAGLGEDEDWSRALADAQRRIRRAIHADSMAMDV